MASLWITEYSGPGKERTQVFETPAQARQTVTIATATYSNIFGLTTHYVRLFAGADCLYLVTYPDANGNYTPVTASVGDPLPSGTIECFEVKKNGKISVIASGGF